MAHKWCCWDLWPGVRLRLGSGRSSVLAVGDRGWHRVLAADEPASRWDLLTQPFPDTGAPPFDAASYRETVLRNRTSARRAQLFSPQSGAHFRVMKQDVMGARVGSEWLRLRPAGSQESRSLRGSSLGLSSAPRLPKVFHSSGCRAEFVSP